MISFEFRREGYIGCSSPSCDLKRAQPPCSLNALEVKAIVSEIFLAVNLLFKNN